MIQAKSHQSGEGGKHVGSRERCVLGFAYPGVSLELAAGWRQTPFFKAFKQTPLCEISLGV